MSNTTKTRRYVQVSNKMAAFFVRKYAAGWTLAKIGKSRGSKTNPGGFPITTVRASLIKSGVTLRARGRVAAS